MKYACTQNAEKKCRIGIVAERQQALRFLPGQLTGPIQVSGGFGSDGIAACESQKQGGTRNTGEAEESGHHPGKDGGKNLPKAK